MSSTVPSERRRSSNWVKTVVRRLEAVRWAPAATAQLSLRQRRESTGTSRRAAAAGREGGGGAGPPGPRRPAPPRKFPPRLDFSAARDHGDHGDEQQRDQRRQRRAL